MSPNAPFGLFPNFQDQSSPDQTSAPSIQSLVPPVQELAAARSPTQAIMAQRKKRPPRPPGALAAAIARSKRARPSSGKYGF